MTVTPFVPEIGQAAFGQPHQVQPCPLYLRAALGLLRDELDRVRHNIAQADVADPFANTGGSFACETFAVEAYSWDEDRRQPWNFTWIPGGVEISWYKHFGRGASVNQPVTPDLVAQLLASCMAAIERFEMEHDPESSDAARLPSYAADDDLREADYVIEATLRCFDANVEAARLGDVAAQSFLLGFVQRAAQPGAVADAVKGVEAAVGVGLTSALAAAAPAGLPVNDA